MDNGNFVVYQGKKRAIKVFIFAEKNFKSAAFDGKSSVVHSHSNVINTILETNLVSRMVLNKCSIVSRSFKPS